MKVAGLILAAGKGQRMRSDIPKVLHQVGGRPMVQFVVKALRDAGVDRVLAVVAPDAPEVEAALGDGVELVYQHERRGTGDAVRQALPALADDELVVILAADTPLLRGEMLANLVAEHEAISEVDPRVELTMVTAWQPDPTGYGRVLRNEFGGVVGVVEQADCTPKQMDIKEISVVLYATTGRVLRRYLPHLSRDNAQGEYYLTQLVAMILAGGGRIETVSAKADEVLGINSRRQLAQANEVLRRRVLGDLMDAGVTLIDPAATYVAAGVTVGRDTTIWPGCYLLDGTVVGDGCTIGPNAHLGGARLGDRVTVHYSMIEGSEVGDDCVVGPYAHIRPGTRLAAGVRVGNYAEVKNSTVGPKTKIPHHSYVGDADIGAGVNVGAGAVFVNYDGRAKHRTVVADGAFIGCNANLVAPISLGAKAYIACGSAVTDDVPAGALAVARARQRNSLGWVDRRFGAPTTKTDTEAERAQEGDPGSRK